MCPYKDLMILSTTRRGVLRIHTRSAKGIGSRSCSLPARAIGEANARPEKRAMMAIQNFIFEKSLIDCDQKEVKRVL